MLEGGTDALILQSYKAYQWVAESLIVLPCHSQGEEEGACPALGQGQGQEQGHSGSFVSRKPGAAWDLVPTGERSFALAHAATYGHSRPATALWSRLLPSNFLYSPWWLCGGTDPEGAGR